MKLLKNILATFLVLMIGVITFFTWNLICGVISNYQSPSIVLISGLPMVIFMIEIYVALFAVFNYIVLNRRDAFFFRKYSLILAVFGVLGIVTSILDGTIIYHTFVGDYIFFAFPLFMLIIHALFLGISVYFAVISIRDICKEKLEKTWKNPRIYWIREVLMGLMLVFALEKLGGFVLLPLYWSSYDSVYVLPFYFQLLVPAFLFAAYMVDRHWLHDKKKNIMLFSIGLGYSIFSLVYMLILAKVMHESYQIIANPLSVVLQLERLLTKPVGFVIMYVFCLLYSGINLGLNIFRLLKEKNGIIIYN